MTSDEVRSVNRSYEIAVRNLNSLAWEVMLPSEKVHDLQAIENKNAMDQNRIPCEVRAEPMQQGEWGYQVDNQIVVNSNELDNPNFMEHVDTIYHEGSHARDTQAQCFQEVRSQYTQEQLAERSTPVPDPETNPEGYWNHPAEVAARQAGEEGVERTMSDREHILEVDRQMNEAHPMNQILQTYDYDALETPVESENTSVENSAHAADTSHSAETSAGISAGLDAGNAGIDASAGVDVGQDAEDF